MAPRVGAALATPFSRFERLTILKAPGFAGGWLLSSEALQAPRSLRLDATHHDHATHQMGVELDAVGQTFGRSAGHLPTLIEQFLADFGAARDLAEQVRRARHDGLGRGTWAGHGVPDFQLEVADPAVAQAGNIWYQGAAARGGDADCLGGVSEKGKIEHVKPVAAVATV